METVLNNPVVQSSLLPLTLSLLLAGVIGFSSRFGKQIVGAALAISLLVTIIQIQGFSFPPRAASQKLPYLIIVAGLIGLLLDAMDNREWGFRLVSLFLPVAVLTWLFGARVTSIDLAGWGYLVAIIAVSVYAYWQCERDRNSIDGGLKLLFISGGLGAIALIGSSAMLAQASFGLMATIGGFLLLNWPKFRFAFGASAQLTTITAMGALVAQCLFYTNASGIALLLLLPLLVIDEIQARIPFLNRVTNPAIRALSLGVIGAALLPLAIGSALLLTESSGMAY